MSRHRNIRKMNYDDERDDIDDEEFHRYSISADDDILPGSEEYMYMKPNSATKAAVCISDFITEEGGGLSELVNDVVDDSGADRSAEAVQRPHEVKEKSAKSISQQSATVERNEIRFGLMPTKQETSEKASMNDTGKLLKGIENLRLTEVKAQGTAESMAAAAASSLGTLTHSPSSKRLTALEAARNATVQPPKAKELIQGSKPTVNLVIVGHVDAGKSTLMGHLLYQLGGVDERTMRRYRMESAKTGKASFAYAWVLDDTQEERQRGVTMDIARTAFETEHRKILILDAPGHKDFIPNMITGAAEADAGILVINATRGEFETGFDQGGQTREHAMLLRSLGVGELVVAINKLDTIDWSQQRYDELCAILKTFLKKQAAYSAVKFIPLSGLEGTNLTRTPPDDHPLRIWYQGPTLLEAVDSLRVPVRSQDRPFRAVINDVHKVSVPTVSVSAKIEAGFVETGEKVYVMPNADPVIVKGINVEASESSGACYAGDHATLTLTAVSSIEPESVTTGQVICRGGQECLIPAKRYLVRLVILNITIPIIKGTRVELFAHCLCEPCTITRLKAELNKSTGEVIRKKPRALTRNMSGMVEIRTERAVSLEPYSECKALGRVTLRSAGQTIAAGIIEQRLE